MTTKILALTDALGNLCDFILLPGQRNDICGVLSLIKDKSFGALLADKAFDADWLIKELTQKGIEPVIPPRKGRNTERCYDRGKYKWRHLIENFFCRIKEFKKIAMRCEKTDESFAANIYSQTKQKISKKACSKDKQPDITFLRCRLIFAHTFSIGFNSGEYGGSGKMICPSLCAISRSTAIL